MEQKEPPKSRLKVEMELDRISNLPSDVIDKILSCLTLKEAVRTSVFSSRWRNKWAMLSGLVFDKKCFSTENCAAFLNIVYHVLLSRIVPIEKFVLSHPHLIPTRDIDRWVLHLSRNSIKVFELRIPDLPKYKMPLCFFSYQDMIALKLSRCLLKPPTAFKGFKTLRRVIFQRVSLVQDVLENLILCSPLLESLEIIKSISPPRTQFGPSTSSYKMIHNECRSMWQIFRAFFHVVGPEMLLDSLQTRLVRPKCSFWVQTAPNLRFLSLHGALEDVSLQNTLNLAVVCFNLWGIYHRQDHVSSSNLAKFFVDLPHIQRLTIDGVAVQYLAVGDLPGRLPKPCLHLNFLSLLVYFNDLAEILTTLYLLRSSPALEVLHVKVRHDEDDFAVDEEAESWLDNLDDDINCSFPNLRLVEITCFSGCKAELDFIRSLLLNSLVLETMTVRAFSADGSSEVLKKLLQLRRTSSAEIIYLEP